MIILLDDHIPCEQFHNIQTIDDIKTTTPNSVVLFDFNKDMMLYCMQNNINYSINVQNSIEAIYANNLNATYILPTKNILKSTQVLAQNYMFDSKIIAKISNETEIAVYAQDEIDGVIFINKLKENDK